MSKSRIGIVKTPVGAADHTCLLMVVNSSDDPIPNANKLFDVDNLGVIEKHVGFKNLHVVNALPRTMYWTPFQFFGDPEVQHTVRISPSTVKGWSIGLIFQKGQQTKLDVKYEIIMSSKFKYEISDG